jgi:hypothetical protein
LAARNRGIGAICQFDRRIVEMCWLGLVGNPAFVTQNGSDLILLKVAGEPALAWPDWFAPATRIWIEGWNEGAVYSPDGILIQFDNGTIWQRDLGPPPRAPRRSKYVFGLGPPRQVNCRNDIGDLNRPASWLFAGEVD